MKNYLHSITKYKQVWCSNITTAYSVKSREKREIKDPQETQLKNGRPAVKGTCPECGTNVFRIGKP